MKDKSKIAKDTADISRLLLQKHTHEQIAKQLGLSRQTVTHRAGNLRKQWRAEAVLNTEEMLNEELMSLNTVIIELWILYEASKKDKVVTTKKASTSPNGKKEEKQSAEVVEKIERNIGDKTILDSILNALDKRAKLLGLHTTHLKVSGNVNVQQTFKQMTDEELANFIKENEKG